MKKSFQILSLAVVLMLLCGQTSGLVKHSYIPPNGFVPDEQTAIRIAEAIWIPIYGAEKIRTERPFKASLDKDVWTVTGTLPEGMMGGVAIAEISKQDARIIRVSHGK